ncbi:hypothetical protein [Rhodococcus sp. LB1]|uniref:hypothetical protein n=1 Tax=Rhodococcus sp. LB1 TaxID=1807499 RepID=UPI000AFD28C5|nr:hypothetical protein [Rhodococcus sp. LB1]
MSARNRAGELTVPKRCVRGHELTPRTTNIQTSANGPVGWSCVRCLREDTWTAHYARHSDPEQRGKPIPADVLAETAFERQKGARPSKHGPLEPWTKRVHFKSGWQYADEDPTPERREARRLATERAAHGVCAQGHIQRPASVYTDTKGREWCRPCRSEYAARRRAMLAASGVA